MTPSDRFRQLAHTLAHGLQTVFAGAARRLDAMDQRLAVELGEELPVEPPEPAVNSDGPPAHWLARVQRSGPPAHWLEDIRRRAANPDRIETFDVTIQSPNDATGQPPDVQNTAETEGSIGSTKPPEGAASNAGVKRGAVKGNQEQVEDEAGGAIRRGVMQPPEGAASNAKVKRSPVTSHGERVEDEASGAIRRGVTQPPDGSTSRRILADMRLLRRTTTGTAVRAVPTIVHPVARKPVEVDGGPAERARPQRQAASDLPRTMAATTRRDAHGDSRGDSRGSHQPIVAVRRGHLDAPMARRGESAEPFEPMAPQPNQWPELPVNTWAEDAGSERKSRESRENVHARRLAHEQEGIG